jgi:hypothetical protein
MYKRFDIRSSHQCPRILTTVTMQFFGLALLLAAASAKDIRFQFQAPPEDIEYGFCGE